RTVYPPTNNNAANRIRTLRFIGHSPVRRAKKRRAAAVGGSVVQRAETRQGKYVLEGDPAFFNQVDRNYGNDDPEQNTLRKWAPADLLEGCPRNACSDEEQSCCQAQPAKDKHRLRKRVRLRQVRIENGRKTEQSNEPGQLDLAVLVMK